MRQISWKILPWHSRLNKLKLLRPDYKSELGVFSNGSTVLQLKDVKRGFGPDSLLPLDIYTFVFNLQYAYWSHNNIMPDEVAYGLSYSHGFMPDKVLSLLSPPTSCQR